MLRSIRSIVCITTESKKGTRSVKVKPIL